MVAWEWVVLALAAVVALQLLALRYALGARVAEEDGGHSGGPGVERAVEPPDEDDRPRGSSGERRCSHCGARNDPGYTYCRRCVRLLGG